jgi:hypothetical protein
MLICSKRGGLRQSRKRKRKKQKEKNTKRKKEKNAATWQKEGAFCGFATKKKMFFLIAFRDLPCRIFLWYEIFLPKYFANQILCCTFVANSTRRAS